MIAQSLKRLPGAFQLVLEQAHDHPQAYLVGGAIRDLLVDRPAYDLDFVLGGDVRPLARRVANALHGAFYMLDEERNIARVIYQNENEQRRRIDFASLQNHDLAYDLAKRDFTINAMALDLNDPTRLIDPLGGAQDLKDKVLRLCSPLAIDEDPVRILRAARLSLSFNLHIHPDTLAAIRRGIPLMHFVSTERQRDELFRMLDSPRLASAIRLLDAFGLLSSLLPELLTLKGVDQPPPHTHDAWDHSLATVTQLERLFSALVGEYHEEDAGNLPIARAVLRLGRFRQQFADHYANRINPERSLRALLFLAALYHDIAKPGTQSIGRDGRIHFYEHEPFGADAIAGRGRELVLSQAEIERLVQIVEGHMRIHSLQQTGSLPSRRAIYRYFRDLDAAGVDICLLTLADTLALAPYNEIEAIYEAELEICQALLETWWEKPASPVNPPRLLTGQELLDTFHLQPGPIIGQALEAVREAQACGEVHSHAEALAFARRWLGERAIGQSGD